VYGYTFVSVQTAPGDCRELRDFAKSVLQNSECLQPNFEKSECLQPNFAKSVNTRQSYTDFANSVNTRRRLIGSPKLQIIFHKRATKYRSLLRKMIYKDKGSYESSPPCTQILQNPSTRGSLCTCRKMLP